VARRWNGWGDDAEAERSRERRRAFLAERIWQRGCDRERAARVGAGRRRRESPAAATAFITDAAIPLDHAFGQGLHDWDRRCATAGSAASPTAVALPGRTPTRVAAWTRRSGSAAAFVIPLRLAARASSATCACP
jgi:hypothetical protein